MSETVYDDPFKMIRNNFNFTFICEFLHNFSSAFFNGPNDVLPTTPVQEKNDLFLVFINTLIVLVYGTLVTLSRRSQED